MAGSSLFLLCRARNQLCALPIQFVEETMRPLPVEPVRGMADWVLGVAVIRGASVPVVDLGALLDNGEAGRPGRFVTVHAGQRTIALAVEEIAGVRGLPPGSQERLPALLQHSRADVLESIGARDGSVLVVLRAIRIVDHVDFAALEGARGAP